MDEVSTALTLNAPRLRQTIHDLRNLFGLIGAARHLLSNSDHRAPREELLKAIEDATIRGGRLTTDLLAGTMGDCITLVRIDDFLGEFEPMMRALVGKSVNLTVDANDPGCIRVARSDLEACMLEVIANACRAGAANLYIRQRQLGDGIWITVVDDGRGMSPTVLKEARNGAEYGQAHGNGLSRVRDFVHRALGKILVRSSPGSGTTISLVLPAVEMSADEDTSALRWSGTARRNLPIMCAPANCTPSWPRLRDGATKRSSYSDLSMRHARRTQSVI